jgi:hypothetical protein
MSKRTNTGTINQITLSRRLDMYRRVVLLVKLIRSSGMDASRHEIAAKRVLVMTSANNMPNLPFICIKAPQLPKPYPS